MKLMYKKWMNVGMAVFFITNSAISQTNDSLKPHHHHLPDVTVVGRNSKNDIQQLPEIVGTSIYAGKKNALIVVDNVKGNTVTNTMRQVMAKVPGIHIWESDGSGIQVGIAARGLSPNRSWEFNVRQNGYDISADPFGYPEAYYNPQLQAVQRIEIVRGQGALQYGPQFGGLVNYILKNGSEIQKKLALETQQTVGSNGLYNTFNAVGGKTKKLHYYSFFDHRNAKGWRENSNYFTNAGFGTVTWQVNNKFSFTAETMLSHIRSKQPGGLTDAAFTNNPRESSRSRNWMDIDWITNALIANYNFNEFTKLNIKLFAVSGNRNSVGYLKSITTKDSINPVTLQYNNRTVDIDQYRNYGAEARFITKYHIGTTQHTIATGLRFYTGNTKRYRDGIGTTGTGYDITLAAPLWPKEINYSSKNMAVFAENIFYVGKKIIVIPGIRYEFISAKAGGRNGYDAGGNEVTLQPEKRNRGFFLAGVGAEYHLNPQTEIYASISQAYRPMQFAELTAPPGSDVIDPNLKDAKGYNADLGYRGKLKDGLFFDVSGFLLQYHNRIGLITQQRTDGSFYNLRTNMGSSFAKGVEAMAEYQLLQPLPSQKKHTGISVFASWGYTDARYSNFKVIIKQGATLVESNLKNKQVENAPKHTLRAGGTFGYKTVSFTGQFSYVSGSYTDAGNTLLPAANGQNGLVPAYHITDITATYNPVKNIQFKAGINNLFNKYYFTRRAGGYPGPGLMPADGRSFFITAGLKL
jgi:Fe(3+) dicitrate transport protein